VFRIAPVRVACAAIALALAFCVSAGAADMVKVLRVSIPIAETGFDPQAAGDAYSNYVNRHIFDALYAYDYLARPYKLVPNTAVALPDISPDGRTWTIRIKPGIYFADDPAFKGKKRELTAEDYAFAWKRILDPKMRSNAFQTLDGKFEGADALVEAARKTGKFDYDAVLEGLQAIDRYTLRLKLNYPSYELLTDLTTPATAAVAREVVDAYGDESTWVMANPVGTGPYRLAQWRRGQKIVLEASPSYREVLFPDSADPSDRAMFAKLRGRKLPLIGRVEISVIEESNPRLLAFENRELDYLAVPIDLIWNVLDPGGKLKARFVQAGVTMGRGTQPAINYTYFNMDDPVVGGYGNERIALRRAIGMAYNTEEEIRIVRQGQAEPATQPIPPNVTGHDPTFSGFIKYDPAGAKALLDKFGYVDRDGDGWRDLPDGRPLVLNLASPPSALDRQYDELWKKSMDAVGVRVEFVKQKWPDLLKMARLGQLQMWTLGNISITPEGFQFLGLLYGPHSGFSNLSRFNLPEFNRLYDQARQMPDTPERTKLFHQMSKLVAAYAPWKLDAYRYETVILQPWVMGYKHNVYYQHPWPYLDIDAKRKGSK
jgi:ABC-type transport system substrate-binding protein